VKVDGESLEVNLVCRNARFLHRMLRDRNPVDLVALRHGRPLHDGTAYRALRRHSARLRAGPKTREAWTKSSARWLGRALDQYFAPDCPHCFFGAIFHASRDLLRAHLVGAGEDVTEGWETEAAVARRWPDLAERYGRIRHARAHWQSFDFPLFKERRALEGDLGELVRVLWEIAREVYRGADLTLPPLESLLRAVSCRRGQMPTYWSIRPNEGYITIGLHNAEGKLKFLKRRIGAPAGMTQRKEAAVAQRRCGRTVPEQLRRASA
jgi:hypothetical protein